MNIVVGVHGRFHGFDLARELHARGHLALLVTTYPGFAVRRFVDRTLPIKTIPKLELFRRASFIRTDDVAIARRFGTFLAKALKPEHDLLVGWSGASLEAARRAKELGIKVVIERGSSHIVHQTRVLSAAYAALDLPWTPTAQETIDRELAEYDLADAIAVPSGFAAQTFIEAGIPAEKLIVNAYGVDLSRFGNDIDAEPGSGKPRIVFVGRVGPRKGVPALIQAFKPIRDKASLHLIGPVEPGMTAVFDRLDMTGVHVRGALPGEALAQEYRNADLFCLPSLEEGLALVLLQAMASGLPCVVTPETGAEDVLTDGESGLIVPSNDVAALTEALDTLTDDVAKRDALGHAARQAVAQGLSWSDYGDRAVSAYRRLLRQEAA